MRGSPRTASFPRATASPLDATRLVARSAQGFARHGVWVFSRGTGDWVEGTGVDRVRAGGGALAEAGTQGSGTEGKSRGCCS